MSDTRREIAERYLNVDADGFINANLDSIEAAMSSYAAAVLEKFEVDLSRCGDESALISLQYVRDQLRARAAQERER